MLVLEDEEEGEYQRRVVVVAAAAAGWKGAEAKEAGASGRLRW